MNFIPNTDSTLTSATQPKVTVRRFKSMGRVPSTVKPSRVLKSSSGLKNEISFSLSFHSQGIPLLVSPCLLRSRNLGQIDLARFMKSHEGWVLELGEVKSSDMGLEQMGRSQKKRLLNSLHFLGGLFGHATKLSVLKK
jgi:hypothetical protein